VPAAHAIQRPPAASAPAGGKWVVQAGSYGSEANAGKVVRKLQEHGFHAFISRFDKGGHAYFRVRVGPYADRAAAEHAMAGVARASGAKAEVAPNS
jgi:DedD protein